MISKGRTNEKNLRISICSAWNVMGIESSILEAGGSLIFYGRDEILRFITSTVDSKSFTPWSGPISKLHSICRKNFLPTPRPLDLKHDQFLKEMKRFYRYSIILFTYEYRPQSLWSYCQIMELLKTNKSHNNFYV